MPKQIEEGHENVPRRSLRLQMKKKKSPQTSNTTIVNMPTEMLSMIFSFVPTSSLTSVGRTCQRWLGILSSKWFRDNYWPRPSEIHLAIELISSGHLPATDLTNLAKKIQTAWSEGYWPGGAEVRCADAMVTFGHLPEDLITSLASRIQSQVPGFQVPLINIRADAAKLQCAAALAATGHLTWVQYMTLEDLELPSSEDIPSLVAQLSGVVDLSNVKGDLVPLLTSLNGNVLTLRDMALDEAATRGLLEALQHGVRSLLLEGSVTLHLPTLLKYNGGGKCHTLGCFDDSRSTLLPQLTAWAEGVGWDGRRDDEERGHTLLWRK